MYKGQPCASKLLQKLQQQKAREAHLFNLRSLQPNTSILECPEVTLSPKKKQMQAENRFTEIQRENRLLFTKITSIMNKRHDSCDPRNDLRANGSLNSTFRRRQFVSIEVENAKLLKRLQERKSDYQLDRFKKDWRKTQKMLSNIATYPVIEQITGKKKRRAVPNDLEGLIEMVVHHPEQFSLSQKRIINGRKFLVSIKFTANRFVILADLQAQKELKVIEIGKGEALKFIQEHCEGNIRNLFDKLNYDAQGGTLSLSSDTIPLQKEPLPQEDTAHQPLKSRKDKQGTRTRKRQSQKPFAEFAQNTAFNKQDLLF